MRAIELDLSTGATVASSTDGSGPGGDVNIIAETLQITESASIRAERSHAVDVAAYDKSAFVEWLKP